MPPSGRASCSTGNRICGQPVVPAAAARSRSPGQEKERSSPPSQEKLEKELADINKESRKLKARLKVLDRRRAELMKELDKE